MPITILATFCFKRRLAWCINLALLGLLNYLFGVHARVHGQEKSTHESVVSAWFLGSGTQDVSVARRAPSNPLCPFALYPRKPGGESLWDFCLRCIRPSVAALPVCPSSFLAPWKQAFCSINANVQPLRGRAEAHKRKKTQRCAVLSCSGTQDWTADLMIMNPFRW